MKIEHTIISKVEELDSIQRAILDARTYQEKSDLAVKLYGHIGWCHGALDKPKEEIPAAMTDGFPFNDGVRIECMLEYLSSYDDGMLAMQELEEELLA